MSIESTLDSLKRLEVDNIGAWPIVLKVIIWIIAAICAGAVIFFLFLSESQAQLEKKLKEEQELLKIFEDKAFEASTLEQLKAQMKSMEASFGALVKQLPSQTEVPGLLEDISKLAFDSGLELNSIKLANERIVEFYAESPIEIVVQGGYHSIGNFVSGVSALPRIVTLHDFSLSPASGNPSMLTMSVVAKTYRYIDREE